MIESEVSIDQPRRRASSLAILVTAIVAISLGFLVMPSSQKVRTGRAKQKLDKEYPGPKDISPIYGGFFVTGKNESFDMNSGKEAQILVFAPKPKEAISTNTILQLDYSFYGGRVNPQPEPLAVCLLAPDPALTGWTLFAKVWIGMTIRKKDKVMVSGMALPLVSSPATPIAVLNSYWTNFSTELKKEVEEKLAANIAIANSFKGIHRFYQDGHGKNYEIDISQNMWNFTQTFDEAYPRAMPER